MPVCELCGKEVTKLSRVKIENAIIAVGPECMRFGTRVEAVRKGATNTHGKVAQPRTFQPGRQGTRDAFEAQELELSDDYPRLIREARSKLNLKQEELAAKLNEKKSVIKDLETGELVPDNALVNKLEKQLRIRLLVPVNKDYKLPPAKKRTLTLGDLMKK